MMKYKTKPKTIEAALKRAVAVLKRDGWTTGAFTGRDDRHCIVGALYAGFNADPLSVGPRLAHKAHQKLDMCAMREGVSHAITWNDNHCMSQDEAIRFIERCIEAQQPQEA